MHMGKMLLGESYETKYDTKEYVRELQDAGVVCAVNMDGYFGKDLEKMQKKQEGFEEMFLILCDDFLRMMILIFAIKRKR